MTRTGTITLFYKDEEVSVKNYKSGTGRKEIINDWKLIYGERFNECVIQINPDVDEDRRSNNTQKYLSNGVS